MSALLATGVALGAAGLLAAVSFRAGRRRRVQSLPRPFLAELSWHKHHCLGESPEQVALELELLFGAGWLDTDCREQDGCARPTPGASACSSRGAAATPDPRRVL